MDTGLEGIDAPIMSLVNKDEPLFMASPTVQRDNETGELSLKSEGKPWTLRAAIITCLMFHTEGSENSMYDYDLARTISNHELDQINLTVADYERISAKMALVGDAMPLMIRGAVIHAMK